MDKGKKFHLIKSWMMIGGAYDSATSSNDTERVKAIKVRMNEKQAEYDLIMLDCPMEFRGYTAEKYEWDKNNVRDYYTKWEREDIFLTKKSLKRCRQWEEKMNLPPFEQIEADRKRKINQSMMEQREEQYAQRERYARNN